MDLIRSASGVPDPTEAIRNGCIGWCMNVDCGLKRLIGQLNMMQLVNARVPCVRDTTKAESSPK